MKQNKYARLVHAKEISKIFNASPHTDHVRHDYVCREIAAGRVIFERGVVIIYLQYKHKVRLTDGVVALSGDVQLKQIAAHTSGKHVAEVTQKFMQRHKSTNVFSRVALQNDRSLNFFKFLGFKKVGDITWKQGTMPGVVLLRPYDPLWRKTDATD